MKIEFQSFFLICIPYMIGSETDVFFIHISASGHVDRFSDFMVKDEVTGEGFPCRGGCHGEADGQPKVLGGGRGGGRRGGRRARPSISSFLIRYF